MTFSWHTQTRPDPISGQISEGGLKRTALIAKARKVVGWFPHAETSSAPVVDAHTQVGSQRKGLMMPTYAPASATPDMSSYAHAITHGMHTTKYTNRQRASS